MPSLWEILQNEISPSLLHQSLGMMDPATGILELGSDPNVIIAAAREDNYEELVSNIAALLHERHHWIQLIGTTSGMYLSLLLELQATVVYSTIDLKGIRSEDLPLLATLGEDNRLILMWGVIESSRLLYNGSRAGDYDALIKKGFGPQFEWLSDHLRQIVLQMFRQTPAEDFATRLWASSDVETLRLVKPNRLLHHGWLVGARHLMECGARINEIFELIAYVQMAGKKADTDYRSHLAGVYGVAHDLFHRVHGEPTLHKELALAVLCDISLNTFVPPVVPLMSGLASGESWSPARLFARCVTGLSGFNFNQDYYINDPDSINAFVRSVWQHLSKSEVGESLWLIEGITSSLLDGVDTAFASQGYYELIDGRLPVAKTEGASHMYYMACCSKAAQIRKQHPGFFALPVCWYLHDRALFHEIFDPVMPPLVRYGENRIGLGLGSQREQGWLEFFLSAAIDRQIIRGIMFYDAAGLGRSLERFCKIADAPDYGKSIVGAMIRGRFGPELGASVRKHSAA